MGGKGRVLQHGSGSGWLAAGRLAEFWRVSGLTMWTIGV